MNKHRTAALFLSALLPLAAQANQEGIWVTSTKPDYLLILPWNLKKEIMAQLADIGRWGGKFIVPIPEATIYEAGTL